jgi:Uma2 family endonuclease
MGQAQHDYIAISNYLTIEREDDVRYEYHDGELFATAGGTLTHSTICNNVAGELRGLTRKTGSCVSFNSEMKIEIVKKNKYVYPDAGLACPKLEESENITGAITNPRLIVEVTSADSEGYDRGNKLKYYFGLPSVLEYLIVAQDKAEVTLWRQRGDLFKLDTYAGLDAVISLESIQGELLLQDIYENVVLPKTDEED